MDNWRSHHINTNKQEQRKNKEIKICETVRHFTSNTTPSKNAGIWLIQFSEEVWVQVDKQDGGEDGGNECSVCPEITVVFH